MILTSLAVISALTTLATEGVKKILDSKGASYSSNILAGIVAVILSAAYGAGYILVTGAAVTAALIAGLICLVFLSWLCAMVGYDKVKQVIKQLTTED